MNIVSFMLFTIIDYKQEMINILFRHAAADRDIGHTDEIQ